MHTKREKEVKLERCRTSPYFHTHFFEAKKRGKVELSATTSIQFSSSVQQDRKQQEHHPFSSSIQQDRENNRSIIHSVHHYQLDLTFLSRAGCTSRWRNGVVLRPSSLPCGRQLTSLGLT
jgi:hypothetical protein